MKKSPDLKIQIGAFFMEFPLRRGVQTGKIVYTCSGTWFTVFHKVNVRMC
jgi:hypothetical protein